ncbi:MAG: CHAD domain-containing protein [Chloroflexota bacterium]
MNNDSLTPTPPPDALSADEPITRAGRRIVRAQFDKLRACEDAVRDSAHVEALHDMRVASRRMRSLLRLLRPSYSPKELKGVLKPLRDLSRALGAVRDFDVLLENAGAYTDKLPTKRQGALAPLLTDWQSRRAEAKQSLVGLLSGEPYATWTAAVERFSERTPTESEPRVCDIVPSLVWERYQAVRRFEALADESGSLDHASLLTLHELRIECKRLRYTLEFFGGVLGGQTPQLIKPLVAAQDQLGALHDADVARERVLEFIVAQTNGSHAINTAALHAATAYLSALQAKSAARRAKFIAQWEAIVAPTFRKRLANAVAAL